MYFQCECIGPDTVFFPVLVWASSLYLVLDGNIMEKKPESWNMAVLQPQVKQGRKTSLNQPHFMESAVE